MRASPLVGVLVGHGDRHGRDDDRAGAAVGPLRHDPPEPGRGHVGVHEQRLQRSGRRELEVAEELDRAAQLGRPGREHLVDGRAPALAHDAGQVRGRLRIARASHAEQPVEQLGSAVEVGLVVAQVGERVGRGLGPQVVELRAEPPETGTLQPAQRLHASGPTGGREPVGHRRGRLAQGGVELAVTERIVHGELLRDGPGGPGLRVEHRVDGREQARVECPHRLTPLHGHRVGERVCEHGTHPLVEPAEELRVTQQLHRTGERAPSGVRCMSVSDASR
ncbi:hypothetical protein GCM10025864_32560 [Luteimicrobium album]|uniref:Uncharacterized protein n=1 Tax=Luteimicrobium album TaxID=1054550 RepID=A0ABQ6I4D5_9MICO|nr:hypothetical protein GCM10025864_32560 [Luteimicrobium album]